MMIRNLPMKTITTLMFGSVAVFGAVSQLAAQVVTHYDATTLGLVDGAPVNTWTDITGNGNDLSVAGGFGATAGRVRSSGPTFT